MSLKKYFLFTLIISFSLQSAWYSPVTNFCKKYKTPVAISLALMSVYVGYKIYKARQTPKTTLGESSSQENINASRDSISHIPIIVKDDAEQKRKEEVDLKRKSEELSAERKIVEEHEEVDRKSSFDDDDYIKIDGPLLHFNLAEVQQFCDSINTRNFSELAKTLGQDISDYDLNGPLLFSQLILECFDLISQRVDFYNKCLIDKSMKLSEDQIRIWQVKLNSTFSNITKQIYETGPWVRGKQIFKDLVARRDSSIYRRTWQEHGQNIGYIVWYLHQQAISKKQSFVEGVYVIEGCREVFDFIMSYNYSYDRSGTLKSSHYHEVNKQKKGINIPKYARKEFSFPNNKQHILVGDIGHDINSTKMDYMPDGRFIWMIKPEGSPTENPEPELKEREESGYDLDQISHLRDFAVNRAKRLIGVKGHAERKEHCVTSITQAFKKLYYAHFPAANSIFRILPAWLYDSTSDCIKDVETYGIKAALHHMNRLNGQSAEQQSVKIALQAELAKYDNLELRKGEEVIFSRAEIESW